MSINLENRELVAERLMLESFMPPAPDIAGAVMLVIRKEACGAPRKVTVKSWVFAGLFIFLSLTSAYFGGGFQTVAAFSGISFILPLGITIGLIITVYGALFIGTNLDALCKKFGR
ncbi:MAG: hypothetical protein LBC77_09025 [Spirochaetaceae bacterium]|jgi:hypothetical protein|nr:hypothetical protein [Spirochaetaceae bacterium]